MTMEPLHASAQRFAVYANVAGTEEWSGKHVCRDASGEVIYYDTFEEAAEAAIEMQDSCLSPNVSYTVEVR